MKSAIVFFVVFAVASAQFLNQPNRRLPFAAPSTFRAPSTFPAPSPSRPIAPARVAGNEAAANIVRYESSDSPDGSFSYAFDTDNGISAQAQGTPRNFGGNPPVVPVVISGSYSYTSPEGEPIAISYIADENGYQPSGNALPTPPPIPPQILRALEYIAKNPQRQ